MSWGDTKGSKAYREVAEPLDKILSSWKPDQGTKTQAIGDEVHVEGL